MRNVDRPVLTATARGPLQLPVIPHPPWLAQAFCSGSPTPPDTWYPEHRTTLGPSTRADAEQAAIEICAVCPVATECLLYALAHQEPHGIWGGLTPRQRRAVAAGKRPAVAPVARTCELASCDNRLPLSSNARTRFCSELHKHYAAASASRAAS